MKNNISVVIPNYNGRQLLETNLPSVIKACGRVEFIIVDDASTDESVNFIKTRYPQIKLVEKVRNDGFATTVNLGVKAASGEFVILLNTDVRPKEDFLPPLLKHFNDEKVFGVGCLEKFREEDKTINRGRGLGKFYRGFLYHSRGEVNLKNTLWVSGGSSAFRKSIWEKLGGMNELYNPFYWEDLDLSYRALKSGYQLVFEAKSQVEHIHQAGTIKSHYSSDQISQISYRNQFIFVWKNITDVKFLIGHFFWLPIHLLSAWVKGNKNMLKGFFTALSQIWEIRRYRQKERALYTKTDSEVLADFDTDENGN